MGLLIKRRPLTMQCGDGKNLKYLRINNTAQVLKSLTIEGPCSRVELSKKLGLSKMTITNIVTTLMKEGYLTETKQNNQTSMPNTGPKPMLLNIETKRIITIGIYISRDSIYGAIIDIVEGEMYCSQKSIVFTISHKELEGKVIAVIDELLQCDKNLNSNIIGIGVASMGLVNIKGIISKITELNQISSFDIKTILEEKYKLPVYVGNDMQASALAEQIYGHGKNKKSFVFLGITNGIGAAVVTNGSVLLGSQGYTTEAGHMCVNDHGEPCTCGNHGCYELYASIAVLLRKSKSLNFLDLLQKIEEKDPLTMKVMEGFIHMTDVALTNLTNLFDPEFIIIGYEAALFDQNILGEIEKRVNDHIIQRELKYIKIIPSYLKELGPIRGAGSLVLIELFRGEGITFAE